MAILINRKKEKAMNNLGNMIKELCLECHTLIAEDGMKYHPEECREAMRSDFTMVEVFRVAMCREVGWSVSTCINEKNNPLLNTVVGYLQQVIHKHLCVYEEVCSDEELARIVNLAITTWGRPYQGNNTENAYLNKVAKRRENNEYSE